MGRVPSRCIILLEDLDAAFTRLVSRAKDKEKDKDKKKSDSKSDNEDESTSNSSSRSHRSRNKENLSDVNTLTLSGLLNALDGVAAAEGCILTFFLCMCRNSRLNYPADYSSTAQQITLINWTLLSVIPAA
jgi:chaperone BCS1